MWPISEPSTRLGQQNHLHLPHEVQLIPHGRTGVHFPGEGVGGDAGLCRWAALTMPWTSSSSVTSSYPPKRRFVSLPDTAPASAPHSILSNHLPCSCFCFYAFSCPWFYSNPWSGSFLLLLLGGEIHPGLQHPDIPPGRGGHPGCTSISNRTLHIVFC